MCGFRQKKNIRKPAVCSKKGDVPAKHVRETTSERQMHVRMHEQSPAAYTNLDTSPLGFLTQKGRKTSHLKVNLLSNFKS